MNQQPQVPLTPELLYRELAALGPFPRDRATADLLCVRPGPDLREPRESLELCAQRGAVGDRWLHKTWMYLPDGSPDPRVQVAMGNGSILGMIQRLTGNHHHPGDTLLTGLDLSMENLPSGSRLRVGGAVLEVSDVENDACAKFAARHGAVVFNWIRDPANRHLRLRGLFARVLQPGLVRRGDTVAPLR
jgi:hypothetical protein